MMTATKLLRGVFLALAIVLAAPLMGVGGAFFGVEAAQAQTVSRIEVSGNQRVDRGTIVQQLTVGVGDAATGAQLSASTAALEATGLFRTVSVTYSGGVLRVRVSENPIVASVLFEGNQRFNDAALLKMVEVGDRGGISDDRLQRDVATIEAAYREAGFNGVTVTPRVEATQGGRMRVTFVVNEGQRTGIAAINFTGNANIGTGTLKGVVRTHETNLLSWLLKDDNYTEQGLMVDAELVRLYYANHGFPDAQVSYVAQYDSSRNGYFINFTVIEGDRYDFGSVGVETSIAGVNPDALRGTIRTSQGGRYSVNDLQKTAEDMAFEATSQGYPFADVRPRLDRDIVNHRFNVTYLVDDGPRLYVERIDITGNDKTRDFVIRRELDFAEGDPFNRSMVARGKSNIEKLGFFSEVRVDATQGSAPDKVIINVSVTEQSTGDYGLTAGYSTTDGVLGEVSLTERNFLGRGQYLRVAVGASQVGKTFDLSFTEPRFMGLRVSSGIDVYHHISDETGSSFYGATSTGGQVRFGLPVTRDISATIFTGFETKLIADTDVPLSDVVNDGDTFNKAWVGYTLTYNTLDDQKHPREGALATFTQQYAGVSFNYIKSEAKARYFLPLMDDLGLVASVKGQAGIINDLSGAGVHPVETIYHGPTLVRGFEARGMGPRIGGTGEPIGSTMYAGASVELQAPVPFLPESYGLSVAAFADAAVIGGAGATPLALDPGSVDNPLKASVGASIIWDSPFGPLRGDFAYVLSKASSDRTQLFQLTLQTLL